MMLKLSSVLDYMVYYIYYLQEFMVCYTYYLQGVIFHASYP